MSKHWEDNYTQYFGVEATGMRIGLCTCRRCGATVIIGDDQADATDLHDDWHRSVAVIGEPCR